MKKILSYLSFLILTLMSFNSLGTNNVLNDDEKNVLSSKIDNTKHKKIERKQIYRSDTIKCDTTINNFSISYTIQENDDIITTFSITDGNGLDTAYYAGREIVLDIKYLKDNIMHKIVDRNFFSSYIPKEELDKYYIVNLFLERVDNNERLIFSLNLCIPDTDVCYDFELSVTKKGDFEIKEIIAEESDEDI